MTKHDRLTPLDQIAKVDSRNLAFVSVNKQTGESTLLTLESHYKDIAFFALHEYVDDSVITQYDTARNLYTYAWFEYRFFNVAEMQALTVLEYAIKEYVGKNNFKAYRKSRAFKGKNDKKVQPPEGLRTLMEYCRDKRLINNEGFSKWHRYPKEQAIHKARRDAYEYLDKSGLTEITWEEPDVSHLQPDPSYDHIQHLIDHTNKIRNTYAHGSGMLYSNVLYTFEMVSEFINQIFSHGNSEKSQSVG